MRRLGWALAISTLLPANAQGAPVLVVDSPIGGESTPLFELLGRQLDLHLGVHAVSRADLLSAGPLYERLIGCRADPGCLTRGLAGSPFPLALVAVANRSLSPPLVTLLLVDQALGVRAKAEWVADASLLQQQLLAELRRMLTEAGFARAGRITIDTDPVGAQLLLDGQPPERDLSGALKASFGRHQLVARAPGFVEERRELTVDEAERPLSIRLEPETSLWPWFVGGGALVALATGLAIALWPRSECLHAIPKGMPSPCP